MARADSLIDELRSKVGKLGEAFDGLAGARRRYVALGGEAFLRSYFFQPDPNSPGKELPREGLDIAPEDVPAALASIEAIEALLATGHMTNLAKLIR